MSSIDKLQMLGALRRFGAMTVSDFANEEARRLEQPPAEGGPSAVHGSRATIGRRQSSGVPGPSGSPL